ncbi:MAG: hypothetical protein ACOH5I_10370 [Oligoflexus sp.]
MRFYSKSLIGGWLIALVSLSTANSAQASFYPPDYIIEKKCLEQGPVEVFAFNQYYGRYPRLQISYWGYLLEEEWGQISVYVSLNGRALSSPMENHNYTETVILNKPYFYLCHAQENDEVEIEGPYPRCRCDHDEGGLAWETEPVPTEEASLFADAKNEYGQANAWDIELAFYSKSGDWDSNDNKNYRFRFEP